MTTTSQGLEDHPDAMQETESFERAPLQVTKRPRMKHGAFQIYTGEGKGKSTASLGLMLRALGAGLKVYYLRMLKPRWKTGELKLCGQPGFHPNLTFRNVPHYWALCVSKNVKQDIDAMRAEMVPEMEDLYEQVHSGAHDLVIVDEINYCLHRGLINLEQVLKVIDGRPEQVELVFTGRYPHEEVLARADVVTEMRKVKHHFDQGVRARVGIEF